MTTAYAQPPMQQGLTLIELIAVMVILGVIAVFAVPAFLDLRGDAKAARNAAWISALTTDVDNNLRFRSISGAATPINSCEDVNPEIQAGRMGRGMPYGVGVAGRVSLITFWGPTPDLWGGSLTRGTCPTQITYCALGEWDAGGSYSTSTGLYMCLCPSPTCS
jgi:prepilin-type N-terminal cleavage/methylation domain-containing protein